MSDPDETADAATENSEGVFHATEVGQRYTTDGRTITETDVVNFAGVSGDFNHLHTDAERMKDSMFGERIAHGMLVVSVATGLIWQDRNEAEREAVVAFYGMDRLRFRAPVFVGETIHVELEIVEKRRRDDGPGNGVVRYDCEVKNQDDDTVVSCEMISLLE